MTNRPNGRGIELVAGDYRATIATVGATLGALTWQGTDLVHPLALSGIPLAYEGKVLAPWPNRIRDGRWEWEGQALQAPITEVATGNALHGLACWLDWLVGRRTERSVEMHATVAAQPGYPFALELVVLYELTEAGLAVALTARNDCGRRAPVGLGLHPYLSVGGRELDELVLGFTAGSVLDVDSRGLPLGERQVAGSEYDFAVPRPVGPTSIDNPFQVVGPWSVRLEDAQAGVGVELRSDAPWLHVYSGELLGRAALAVEPTTCPPNAFNSGEDVIVLEPGEETSLTCRIAGVSVRT